MLERRSDSASGSSGQLQLTPEAIELANAYGPYTHGTWAGPSVTVGNEEALSGRGAFMASVIRQALVTRFSADEMASMTLVDVGCYDGWLICQLEDLPFARMIGIEPRQKNLDKGRMIRGLLGIETRCEFRQGAIENLPEALAGVKADVVICAGLFHHLSSTADGVARLHEICEQFLFLETICFPSSLEDSRLKQALELKDLPYFFGNEQFGVSGHKLESGYYDGSATRMSVVSLPSIGALRMFLEVQGFADVSVVADPEAYAKAVDGGWRKFSAVCMTANKVKAGPDVSTWVDAYESGIICTLLPLPVARALYTRFCLGQNPEDFSPLAQVAEDLVAQHGDRYGELFETLSALTDDRFTQEIVKNLRYAPSDKIALEYGKALLADGRLPEAESVLVTVTRRLNGDWRAVYRAFCVMAWSLRERQHAVEAARYEQLCLTANPAFPDRLLAGSWALFRRPETNLAEASR